MTQQLAGGTLRDGWCDLAEEVRGRKDLGGNVWECEMLVSYELGAGDGYEL